MGEVQDFGLVRGRVVVENAVDRRHGSFVYRLVVDGFHLAFPVDAFD
jgi:hypothetical protein